MRRRRFWLLLKLGVTALLIYLLSTRVDGARLGSLLSQTTPLYLIAALAMQLLAYLLGAVRWCLLMRANDASIRLGSVLPSYLLGLFANNFLPTGVGGDAVRTAHLHHLGHRLHALVSSAFMDRLIGLIAVLLLGGTAIHFSRALSLDAKGAWGLAVAAAALLLPMALLLSPGIGRWLDGLSSRHHQGRIGRFLVETAVLVHQYRNRGLLLAGMLLLTLGLQTLVVCAYALLAAGIGLGLPLLTFLAVIPLVVMTSSLPISLGGLGVREGALVALLVLAGADEQQAISLSILYLLINSLATLPWGYFAWTLRRQRPAR